MRIHERSGVWFVLIQATTASLLVLLMASAASARNDKLEVEVETARQYAGKQSIGPMPFYFAGQGHPAETKSFGEMRTDKRTRAFGRDDLQACSVAFQSAIIQLQKRATELGANAIVDITTVTAGNVSESPNSFVCAVGNVVANVALKGRAVTLAK